MIKKAVFVLIWLQMTTCFHGFNFNFAKEFQKASTEWDFKHISHEFAEERKKISSLFNADKAFKDFTHVFQKSYSSPDEFKYRMKIFEENFKTIKRENESYRGLKFGLTPFLDLTDDEFISSYTMTDYMKEYIKSMSEHKRRTDRAVKTKKQKKNNLRKLVEKRAPHHKNWREGLRENLNKNLKHRKQSRKKHRSDKSDDFSNNSDSRRKTSRNSRHSHSHGHDYKRVLTLTTLVRPTAFAYFGAQDNQFSGFTHNFNFANSNQFSQRMEDHRSSEFVSDDKSEKIRRRTDQQPRNSQPLEKSKLHRSSSTVKQESTDHLPAKSQNTQSSNSNSRDSSSIGASLSNTSKTQHTNSSGKTALIRKTELLKGNIAQQQTEASIKPIAHAPPHQHTATSDSKQSVTGAAMSSQSNQNDPAKSQAQNNKPLAVQASAEKSSYHAQQPSQVVHTGHIVPENQSSKTNVSNQEANNKASAISSPSQINQQIKPNNNHHAKPEEKQATGITSEIQTASTKHTANPSTNSHNSHTTQHKQPVSVQASEEKETQTHKKVSEAIQTHSQQTQSQSKDSQQNQESNYQGQPSPSLHLPSHSSTNTKIEAKTEPKVPESSKNTFDLNSSTVNHLKNNPLFKQNLDIIDVYTMVNKKEYNLSEYPKHINWRSIDKVTEVRTQKRCACCYIFSAIGALEAQLLIRKNENSDLSEQQILDCGDEYGNKGCVGGLPANVYNYIIDKSVASEKEYEYLGEKKECKVKHALESNHIPSHGINLKEISNLDYVVLDNHVLALIAALQFGPVAVNHKINNKFKLYAEGIIGEEVCNSDDTKIPNHSTLLVGYNLEASTPYFLFKNSWGSAWGEQGFFRIKIGELSRNNKGLCLIAQYPLNVLPVILSN